MSALSFLAAAILALALTAGPVSAAPAPAAEPAPAQPAPAQPAPVLESETPIAFPLTRIVPKGEARAIAFLTSLFPDCSSQGPVVIRLLSQPKHGRVTVEDENSFPRYEPASPLAACNARKVPGKRVTFESDEKFEGTDAFRMLVINADGSGYEVAVKMLVR
ncbi:hypothetical protein FMGBMHLM_0058 [Methylobacterium aerolatum]|nr:hypothetical protein FMGBMHLM_0058 [Methylobacterium aerolatum]